MKHKLVALLLAFAFLAAGEARAQTDTRELQMIARAVAFAQGLPRGVIEVAVVDGPGADAVAVYRTEPGACRDGRPSLDFRSLGVWRGRQVHQ